MIEADHIDASSAPVTSSAVVGVELDGERVLYHEELHTVHLLNPTATIIWNCLDGSTVLMGLSVELADAFSADIDVVRSDVVEAVRDLGRQGLLEGVAADPELVSANQLVPATPSEPPDDR